MKMKYFDPTMQLLPVDLEDILCASPDLDGMEQGDDEVNTDIIQ